MSGAILTGSQVYGTPKPLSDLDMVVLVTKEDLGVLRRLCPDKGGDVVLSGGTGAEASLRFARLNLIVTTDPERFGAWRTATEELKSRKPVTREQAVKAVKERLAGVLEAKQERLAWPCGLCPPHEHQGDACDLCKPHEHVTASKS